MPDNPNPWGNRGKKPSELDELIQQGIKKLFGIRFHFLQLGQLQ